MAASLPKGKWGWIGEHLSKECRGKKVGEISQGETHRRDVYSVPPPPPFLLLSFPPYPTHPFHSLAEHALLLVHL